VTEAEEHVALDGDWLVLALSARNVALLRRAVGTLAARLEDTRANLAWRSLRTWALRFPAAYQSRREQSAYEERHDADIRADLIAAAHRVLVALDAGTPVRYQATAADDLLRVLGVARLVLVGWGPSRTKRRTATANYLTAVQHDIVVTLRPELTGVGPE
jgi:hypothetical protein